jgi:hypothetical protein
MMGLAPVLSKDDVATIVSIASTESSLAMPAVIALSISCIPEAKAGMASIRTAHAGSPQAADIDRFLIEQPPNQCDNNGRLVPKQFTGMVTGPPASQGMRPSEPPNASQVRAALDSPQAKPVLQVLLDVRCTPEHAEAVGEMRRAWRGRASPDATGTIRDPVAQAVIANCLIQADASFKPASPETFEATKLLRTAIPSNDVMTVLAAVQGLAIIGADQDVMSIAKVPQRMPDLLNSIVRIVGFTCGASNLKVIAAIRKEAATQQLRERVDTVYSHVEPVREETCGKGK